MDGDMMIYAVTWENMPGRAALLVEGATPREAAETARRRHRLRRGTLVKVWKIARDGAGARVLEPMHRVLL